MNIRTRTENIIDSFDWDRLVVETYGKPYCYQQQNGCQDRGVFRFKVPDVDDDFKRDTVPEKINHEKMGVSFAAWLKRDPKTPLRDGTTEEWGIGMWWERNFYPDIQMVANDLHAKGLLDAGAYAIEIDW